jgi:hypothetical protein
VHDERPPLAVRTKPALDLFVHRWRVLSLQRYRQQSGWLVDGDQDVVLVDHFQISHGPEARPPAGAPGPVHPEADDIAGSEQMRCVGKYRFEVVEVNFAAFQRRNCAGTGAESVLRSEEFIEADAHVVTRDGPA